MSPLLIALGVAILVYVIFILVVPKAMPTESDDYLRDALNRLAEENVVAEKARDEVLRDQLGETTPLVRMIFGSSVMRPVYEAALQAGYQNNLQHLLIRMMIAFLVGVVLGFYFRQPLLAPILGLVLAYLYPLRHCRKKVTKRNNAFINQFPDALDIIVRSVRSGFPLSVALQMLAENAEEPVRTEFRQVTDEIALGRNLNQALSRLAVRINEPDIRFFVVVLTVQQETGGNLAEIVSNLSNIIRKRKQIRHKIRALTSEGRATGLVLGSLPVLVFGALTVVQPTYLEPFYTDPLGMKLMGAVIGLLITCYFVVKQMINVEI